MPVAAPRCALSLSNHPLDHPHSSVRVLRRCPYAPFGSSCCVRASHRNPTAPAPVSFPGNILPLFPTTICSLKNLTSRSHRARQRGVCALSLRFMSACLDRRCSCDTHCSRRGDSTRNSARVGASARFQVLAVARFFLFPFHWFALRSIRLRSASAALSVRLVPPLRCRRPAPRHAVAFVYRRARAECVRPEGVVLRPHHRERCAYADGDVPSPAMRSCVCACAGACPSGAVHPHIRITIALFYL